MLSRRPSRIVRRIVKELQKAKFVSEVGIETTEVFKGGSQGQGTAVPRHFDIDLVLYSRDLKVEYFIADEDGHRVVSEYLANIDDYLKRQLQNSYTVEDTTTVAIKFKFNVPVNHPMDVDLLLSPYFEDQHHFLRQLQTVDPPDRGLFSASTSKWQTKFIQGQHHWVKEFCRRAKAWKNMTWKGIKEGRPKSYLMCMLVIVAYNRVPPEKKAVRRMRSFAPRMTLEFKRLVTEIQSTPYLDLSVPGSDGYIQDQYKDLLDRPPRIIDPVNPANNLYKSGISHTPGGRKWDSFAAEVDSLNLALSLDKIMARGVF